MLESLGKLISMFIYHKELIASLARLNENVLDYKIDQKDKYCRICREFIEIFFADASAFYRLAPRREDQYEQYVWHNRPDLDDLEFEGRYPVVFSIHDKDNPVINAINSNNSYTITNINEWEDKHPNWRKSMHQEDRAQSLYKWIVTIPVRNLQVKSKSYCAIVLFYERLRKENENIPLFNDWDPMVNFMSYYTGLLVAASRGHLERQERIQNILQHELKQTVDTLQKNAFNLYELIKFGPPRNIPDINYQTYLTSSVRPK